MPEYESRSSVQDKLDQILDSDLNDSRLGNLPTEEMNDELEKRRIQLDWITKRMNEFVNSDMRARLLEARTKLETEIGRLQTELAQRRNTGVMF